MITLLAFLLRIFLLVIFTFAFMVLFEHGPANYPDNAKKEWSGLVAYAESFQKASPPAAAPVSPSTTIVEPELPRP